MNHTPWPWTSRVWMQDDEEVALIREKLGREPTPALTNEGQRYVMAGGKRVALVDMQRDDIKRSERWQCDDPERDANAKLIAAAPALLAALEAMVAHYVDLASSGDCGKWDPESEDEVKQARLALNAAKGKG